MLDLLDGGVVCVWKPSLGIGMFPVGSGILRVMFGVEEKEERKKILEMVGGLFVVESQGDWICTLSRDS